MNLDRPAEVISNRDRSQLEQAKVKLADHEEFNLIDAFRIFDVQGNGWITQNEIVTGLN